MADEHRAGPQTRDEALEQGEPVEVEVVGRLVEQDDVEAAEQQRRQTGAGRLPARQRRHREVRVDVEAHLRQDRGQPVVEVGRAQGEPLLERDGVLVVGPRRPRPERLGGGVHPLLRGGHARPPGEVGPQRLARAPLGLLGEVADDGVRRGEPHRARVGRVLARQHPQQRRLAGAVRADETDDVAGGHHEVEAGEQGPLGVAGGEVARDEGGCHRGSLAGRPRTPTTGFRSGRRDVWGVQSDG